MTEPRVMTFAQFTAERGLTHTADVDGHIHAGLRSKPQTKTYQRFYDRKLTELQDARDEAMALYRAEIAAGRIREPSNYERLLASAAGDPETPSTQAAKRILEKRAERSHERGQ